MNIEKIQGESTITSIRFLDIQKELIDIDSIFRSTNSNFSKTLIELGLIPVFDFSKMNNKRFYSHEFLTTFMEFLKHRESTFTPYFYSNTLTKDRFRNSLIKKIKTTFGVLVWEDVQDLSEFALKLEQRDCSVMTGIEVFLASERKLKRMKHIKKHLEKNGLTFLNDVYFEELQNKLSLFH